MKHSIEEIAEKHKATIKYDVLKLNVSGCYIGRRHIVMGSYIIKELHDVSFFHELAHIEDNIFKRKDRFDQEVHAWVLGFQLAERYGYTFSRDTRSECAKWLKTYIDTGMANYPVHHS